MKARVSLVAIASFAFFGLFQQASASVLYDNGPIGGAGGNNIEAGYAISDSFLLSSSSILTGVDFGAMVYRNANNLNTVDWAITTSPDTYPTTSSPGTFVGTASVTTGSIVAYSTNPLGVEFQTTQDSFSLPNIMLNAGTYYLVLQNAANGTIQPLYWDVNFGPSSATESNPHQTAYSNSFQILGTSSEITPIPASLPLFATGLGFLGLLGWRKKKAAGLAA